MSSCYRLCGVSDFLPPPKNILVHSNSYAARTGRSRGRVTGNVHVVIVSFPTNEVQIGKKSFPLQEINFKLLRVLVKLHKGTG